LIEINTQDPAYVIIGRFMGHIVFKCPRTGLNVQHWLADEPELGHLRTSHESVVCKACSGLHFIDRSSGKLLGQRED
jgi:hypothetical protein